MYGAIAVGLPRRIRELIRRHRNLLRLPLLLRLLPLRIQRLLESRYVDCVATLSRHQLGEIDWKSERVVKPECIFARDGPSNRVRALSCFCRRDFVETPHAAVDCSEESLLFSESRLDDV